MGLRFDYEYATLNYHSYCNTGYNVYHYEPESAEQELYKYVSVDISEKGKLDNSFFEVLPKISVSYNFDVAGNANLYASATKGYKAGGFCKRRRAYKLEK